MTVSSLEARNEYVSAASQTVFNWTFKIFIASDLKVYVTPSGQDSDDATDLTTDYVVDPGSIGVDAGGFFTFNTPLNAGDKVSIVSDIPLDRTVDYQNNGDFRPDTVNGDNDRQVAQIKQLFESVNKTLVFNQSSQNTSGLTISVPEALKFLRWKADLSGLENIDLTQLGTPTNANIITYNEGSTGAVDRTVEAKLQERITVEDFDDGVLSDTLVLKAAFNAMPTNGGFIALQPGKEYSFDPSAAFGINLQSLTNFTILGNGATIKCIDSAPNVGDGVIMWMEGCENGYVENLTLDGNLQNRTGTVSAGSHNIKLRNKNQNIHFKNCNFPNGTNDGFYMDATAGATIDTVPRDIHLEDCTALESYRVNLALIETERVKVTRGRYFSENVSGSLLQAGIDLEDDNIYGNRNTVIDGADVSGNSLVGIQITGILGPTNCIVRNVESGACDDTALKISKSTDTLIENITIGETTGAVVRGIIDVGAGGAVNVTIKGVVFTNANPTGVGTNSCIQVSGNATGSNISDIIINGCNCIGVVDSSPDAVLNNVTVNDSTAGAPISIVGKRHKITDIKQFNTALGSVVNASANGTEIDGFQSVDCAGGTVLNWNRAGAVLKNASSIQTVSIPSGQEAFGFNGAPSLISAIHAESAGTDYDGSNILRFDLGVASGTVLEGISKGFWTNNRMSSSRGDGDHTITRGIDERTQLFDTALTANRIVTLSTTNAKNGDEFKFVRSATGAFTLDINGLKSLSTNQWCEVQFITGAWILSQFGSL